MSHNHNQYFHYLKKRSPLALLYRRYWLYPKLSSYLNGCVLDVGCDIGDFVSFRPETIGVDVNHEAVEFCKGQGLNVVQMEIDQLPFKSNEFDGVLLVNVLEHIECPGPLISEIYRVMKSSGNLIVGVPGYRGYASDPDHKFFYDEKIMVLTLEDAGFRLQRTIGMPLKSDFLSAYIRQYYLYGIFIHD